MTNSVSVVYDLAFPSPITLKEISSIVVVAELWRREIDAYLESNNLYKFNLTQHIRLRNRIPDMPSTIYNQLSNYIVTFRKSIEKWAWYHCYKVFISPDRNKDKCFNNILNHIHDFAWDWNGAIHYVRTARRMLQCDRFSLVEKLRIACLYCFEDDIRRIWPSLSTKINFEKFSFYEFPQLFYWANKLRMPVPHSCYAYNYYDPSSINRILDCGSPHNQSSLEYFWKRVVPFEGQWRTVIFVCAERVELFARFILPQFSERQLKAFLAEHASGLIFYLLMCDVGRCSVLPTWMYIRNKMSGDGFRRLIMDLLLKEAESSLDEVSLKLSLEIWYSAPRHIKQPIFDDLFFNEPSFLNLGWTIKQSKPRQMKLLIAVLHDATLEERSVFWHKHWRALVRDAVIEDVHEMMKSCFRNKHEIRLFKNETMCKYKNIKSYCISSLKKCCFDKLNKFLDFYCPDDQKRRQLKQRLLRGNCFTTVNDLRLYHAFKPLNKFIDDAFEMNDDRVEFKYRFVSSPRTEQFLIKCIREGDFIFPVEFVDTLGSEQQGIVPLKTRLFDSFKEQLIDGWFRTIQHVNIDHVRRILIWLLGNEDEVIRFKQSLPVDDIFRNLVQLKLNKRRSRRSGGKRNEFRGKLDYFLMWYFNDDCKKIRSFKRRFPDELKLLAPRS